MRVPYTPVVRDKYLEQWCPEEMINTMQAESDAAYAKRGVEAEIVLEEKGYILKMYVQGKHVGGLQQI